MNQLKEFMPLSLELKDIYKIYQKINKCENDEIIFIRKGYYKYILYMRFKPDNKEVVITLREINGGQTSIDKIRDIIESLDKKELKYPRYISKIKMNGQSYSINTRKFYNKVKLYYTDFIFTFTIKTNLTSFDSTDRLSDDFRKIYYLYLTGLDYLNDVKDVDTNSINDLDKILISPELSKYIVIHDLYDFTSNLEKEICKYFTLDNILDEDLEIKITDNEIFIRNSYSEDKEEFKLSRENILNFKEGQYDTNS